MRKSSEFRAHQRNTSDRITVVKLTVHLAH